MNRLAVIGMSMLTATGCPNRDKKELPADPEGMVRVEGKKLSVPRPEGYEQIKEGDSSIEGLADRGGISMVKRKRGDEATSIAVDVGEAATDSWSRTSCKNVSQVVGEKLDVTSKDPEVIDLPTGETCHFTTEKDGKRQHEFFHVAGKPPIIVACYGRGAELTSDCKHVASWIRN